jgi:hypothetical protein
MGKGVRGREGEAVIVVAVVAVVVVEVVVGGGVVDGVRPLFGIVVRGSKGTVFEREKVGRKSHTDRRRE